MMAAEELGSSAELEKDIHELEPLIQDTAIRIISVAEGYFEAATVEDLQTFDKANRNFKNSLRLLAVRLQSFKKFQSKVFAI